MANTEPLALLAEFLLPRAQLVPSAHSSALHPPPPPPLPPPSEAPPPGARAALAQEAQRERRALLRHQLKRSLGKVDTRAPPPRSWVAPPAADGKTFKLRGSSIYSHRRSLVAGPTAADVFAPEVPETRPARPLARPLPAAGQEGEGAGGGDETSAGAATLQSQANAAAASGQGIPHPRSVRWYRVDVPSLTTLRDALNTMRVRNEAAAFLQKVYRGWESKAAWKRLRLRMRVRAVQEAHMDAKRAAAEARRAYERRMAAALQSRFKGWLWRVRLARMQAASVVLQTMVRGFQGRRRAEQEERTRLEGLPVWTVFERGLTVSGVPLLVTVKRSGYSYKFLGVDLRKCATYVGYCFGPQTLAVIDHTQPKPPTDAEVVANAFQRPPGTDRG